MTQRSRSRGVLILVDVINHFEFPDGPRLLRHSLRIVPALSRLKSRAKQMNIPVIYANDNFGLWRSNARDIIAHCTRSDAPGRKFVQNLLPDDDDYFVLKPMHSVFYQTPLDTLLRVLGTSSLTLAGIATNSCIVYSAHDAKMRGLSFVVAGDCCAARSKREHGQALAHIKDISGADVLPSKSIRFKPGS